MGTGAGSIEVSIESIIEAWETQGDGDVWLRLDCSEAVHEAITAAADRADEASAEHDTQTMTITPCPGGFAVEVGPVFFEPGLDVWVRSFVDSLEGHGVQGRLTAVQDYWGSPLLDASLPPVVTLFAWWDLDVFGTDLQLGRAPTAGMRRAVEETLAWALRDPGTVTLRQDSLSLHVGPEGLAHHLSRALARGYGGGVEVVDELGRRARHASFSAGEAVFQVVGGEEDPVDELRALAVRLAPLVTLAFVRVTQRGALGITYLDAVQPLPGALQEVDVRYSRPLMERYLPDVHGVQVVNEDHLAAVPDLAGWEVTDLGGGRTLVETPDLERWYAAGAPPAAVLERARADWAPTLLTPELRFAN